MSYTLRGRIESRLAALALPVAVALALSAALHVWWPAQVAALMCAVGLALDVGAYHPLLPYQPGWVALPLGALELAATMGLVRALHVGAPLRPALAFFVAAWVWARVVEHAALPFARLEYVEDGGELGRTGALLGVAVAALLAAAGGTAWATQPPTVHLHGVVRGPLTITREETVEGGVVRGGIVVRADGVTLRDVSVIGGENGIDVEDSKRVKLVRVHVMGAREDGIHARGSAVEIRDCVVDAPPHTQGIDVSFGMSAGMTMVDGCVVHGGDVGITVHTQMATLEHNVVTGTQVHGIELTEMSMGHVTSNEVRDGRGVGVYCGDHSECRIDKTSVIGMRAAPGSTWLGGFAVQSAYEADAHVTRTTRVHARGVSAVGGATLR